MRNGIKKLIKYIRTSLKNYEDETIATIHSLGILYGR